jgi:putative redox protein
LPAQIDLTYTGNLRCTARQISTGHTLATDAPAGQGGLGEDFSATDLVVVALGTCILTTLAIVGQRHQLDLAGMSACMEKEMAAAPVRRIGSIGMTITFPLGLRLSPADRDRLENAARRCPVKQSLHPEIDIRVEFVYPDG